MTDVKACVVVTTLPSREAAEKLAIAVLEQRLAACAQIHAIESFYWWDGKINSDQEQIIHFKSSVACYPALETLIRQNHPYDTPEILRLAVDGGAERYLDWIVREAPGPA
jgi:periplasmic divalent cation tolerance protein